MQALKDQAPEVRKGAAQSLVPPLLEGARSSEARVRSEMLRALGQSTCTIQPLRGSPLGGVYPPSLRNRAAMQRPGGLWTVTIFSGAQTLKARDPRQFRDEVPRS